MEKAFAKFKGLLRKLAARSVARLWDALGDLLDASPRKNTPTISPAPDIVHSFGIHLAPEAVRF
jgi:hypothetical protein